MTAYLHGSKKIVLIASSSIDPIWKPVAEDLSGRGYDVIAYEADRVASGETAFSLQLNQDGLTVNYDGRRIRLDDIAAAWSRRPNMFSGDLPDLALQTSLDRERKGVQNFVWDQIPDEVWLNSPRNMRRAEPKLRQLMIARRIGFTVPDTMVTNRWEDIVGGLPEQVIEKPVVSPSLLTAEGRKVVYTEVFENDPAQLPTDANPFPGLWQPLLGKNREWRITVVGRDTFDAVVETTDSAKDDWRRHVYTDAVTFVKGTFPNDLKEKCFAYLEAEHLQFGAFDFIEDNDGIKFLECNPSGQYTWLESGLGFPIAKAIADKLSAIAEH